MERFSYKGGCGVCEYMHIKAFKRRSGLGYSKRLRVNSNKILFKTVVSLRN